MAERLEFDAPAAAPAEGGERKLEFDTPSKEQELRGKYGKEIAQRGEPGYGERFLDSLTAGAIRPLSGATRVVGGLFDPSSTAGERWRAGVGAAEDYFKKGEENTAGPLGVATDIGGAVAGGVGGVGRATLGRLMARGAVGGAVEGASRNAEDLPGATKGALIGGATGGAVAGAVGKLIPGVRGAEKEARVAARGETPEEIKTVAKDIYKQIDNAGIAYGQPQTATLKAGLDDLIATNQYNPIAHQKISGYVDQLDKLAQHPGGMKFTDLHNLRSALATEARGPDASTRGAASKVIEEIDKLVQGNQPAVNPNNLDLKEIYPRASKLWKAASVSDDVGYLAGKAERKAASKTGVNPDEANRGAFRPLLEKAEKPGAYSPFNKDEEQKALLAKIVKGDWLQNRYRDAGAVAGSPTTRLLTGAGAGALGLTGGLGPLASGAGVAGAAVGGLAQKGLNRLAANRGAENIDQLIRHITTGSTAPSTRDPSRRALAILMAKRLAQRGGGVEGGKIAEENR
jgi:hypothetical protein